LITVVPIKLKISDVLASLPDARHAASVSKCCFYAAGTDIDATPTYPAAYTNTNIMSVIATDENDQLANYSNFGLHNTDLAAPGSKILSTILNGQVRLAGYEMIMAPENVLLCLAGCRMATGPKTHS